MDDLLTRINEPTKLCAMTIASNWQESGHSISPVFGQLCADQPKVHSSQVGTDYNQRIPVNSQIQQ